MNPSLFVIGKATLGSYPDESLRRIALSALAADATLVNGWTEEHRQRLARYRDDSSALVAAAARSIFPD